MPLVKNIFLKFIKKFFFLCAVCVNAFTARAWKEEILRNIIMLITSRRQFVIW